MGQPIFLAIKQQQAEEKSRKRLKIRYDYLVMGLLGVFLGQAEILAPGYLPLALIYWSWFAPINRRLLVLVSFSTGLGLYLSGNLINFKYLLAGLLGLSLSNLLKRISLPWAVAFFYLLISLALAYFNNLMAYQYFYLLAEVVIIFSLSSLGQEGAKEILTPRKNLGKMAVITLFILLCGFIIGLVSFAIVPDAVLDIIILFFSLIMAHNFGFATGIVTAVLFGLVMVISKVIPVIALMKYIVFALVSGLFYSRSKLWLLLVFPLAFAIYSGFSPSIYDFKASLLEFLIAWLLYLLIPSAFWEQFLLDFHSQEAAWKGLELKPDLRRHLGELSSVFRELSATFKEVLPGHESKLVFLDDFAYIFKNKICNHCQRNKICWQQERENSLLKLRELVQKGEEKGKLDGELLNQCLAGMCPYRSQILNGARASFELYQLNKFWREKLMNKQKLVSEQLAGVSKIISQFSNSPLAALQGKTTLDQLKEKALARGIEIYNLELNTYSRSGKLSFVAEFEPCANQRPCQSQFLDLINSWFNYDFRLITMNCGNKLKDQPCKVVYGPRGKYKLDLAYLQFAKGEVSGDSFLYKPLKNGQDLIVLSDGMGVGTKAKRESERAIKLLERIIDAGFEQDLAIETINSALYLRNKEENFTTLDIAVFDTFSGEITFTKIGAVASYIKHNWELVKIESPSLPAGILDKIEVTPRTYSLLGNDFVVMMTDGILDLRRELVYNEEWLEQILKSSSFDRAQDLADYLKEVIMTNTKQVTDDMTIVVLKVEEILHKRRKFKV